MVGLSAFARLAGMTMLSGLRCLSVLVVLSVMTAFGAEFERPKAKPKAPERQRLPGEYSVARIGMLPVTAEKGRALMYTEQYLAFDGDSEKLAEADVVEQTRAVLKALDKEMQYFRSGLKQCMRLHICFKREGDRAAIQHVLDEELGARLPAVTFVVSDLPVAEALVGVDAVGYTGYFAPGFKDTRIPVISHREGVHGAKHAFLPPGRSIFVSGQAVKGEDVADSVQQTLEQLSGTLRFLDRGWTNVVAMRTFLRDPVSNAAVVLTNVTARCEGGRVPPQVFVEWTMKHDLEIELVVDGGPAQPELEQVEYLTPPEMKASPAFSRVLRVNYGKLVYTSGVTGVPGAEPKDQAEAIFNEIKMTTAVFRTDERRYLSATYYVVDGAASKALNEVRSKFVLPDRPPASSKAMVRGLGLPGAVMSVDMIAVADP